jgi:hypothetical protein
LGKRPLPAIGQQSTRQVQRLQHGILHVISSEN